MIRRAIAADESAIRACAERAYAHYIPRIGRKPAPMLADYAAQIRASDVYVASDDCGELTGFIVFYRDGEAMILENIAVLPERAGQGIGRTLIAFCEEAARQAGLSAVVLYTNAAMTENIALYPRLGFIETDRRSEDGFNRVYFRKHLATQPGR